MLPVQFNFESHLYYAISGELFFCHVQKLWHGILSGHLFL